MIENKQIERIIDRWFIDNKISNFYNGQETVFLEIADYIFYEPEIINDINRTCHLRIKVGKRFYEKTSV